MITVDNRKIDYHEVGDGATVLFIPGSYSTFKAWNGMQKRLPQHYRFIGTSLCGYGGTEETRCLDDFGMKHLVRVIEAVAKKISDPVHLVGHSLGGTAALATALSSTVEVLSITTFEASPLAILQERDHTEMLEKTKRICAAWGLGKFPNTRRLCLRVMGCGLMCPYLDAFIDQSKAFEILISATSPRRWSRYRSKPPQQRNSTRNGSTLLGYPTDRKGVEGGYESPDYLPSFYSMINLAEGTTSP